MLKAFFRKARNVKIVALLVAALFSMTVLSAIFCNPAVYSGTMRAIDKNKSRAMMLSAVVTVASTVITTLPDDTASPLAEELSDLSAPLLAIVCILFLEKYLLTTLEMAAFTFLLPTAFVILIMYQLSAKKRYYNVAVKLLLIALVCALIVPVSVGITRMIEGTFAQSIDNIFEKVQDLSNAFSQMNGKEDTNAIVNFFTGLSSGIASLFEIAQDILTIMIDGVAILLITSCIMPVLTIVLFVWCIKSIVHGRMDNLEDSAMAVLSRLPNVKLLGKGKDQPSEQGNQNEPE